MRQSGGHFGAKSALLAVGFGCAALSVAPAMAADETPASKDQAGAVSGFEGVRAFRDPETGELRQPTREEAQALREREPALRKSDSGKVRTPLAVLRRGDGTVSAVMGTRSLDALMATRDANGNLIVRHAKDLSSVPTQAGTPREDR